MKVLYAAPYRDGTGYAEAALGYIQALDKVGVDVVCRPIKLNAAKVDIPASILSLEQKDLQGVTHFLQHSLPNHFEYTSKLKCIGLFAWETSRIPPRWARRLRQMDAVIAISAMQGNACRQAGIRKIAVVPHVVEPFPNNVPILPELARYRTGDTFLFYSIGEWVTRKNWPALLRAFYSEFRPSDNVRLVIKSNVPGKSPEESEQIIREQCKQIRDGLRLGRSHQPEILLTRRFSRAEMQSLHGSCDCYVSTSFGEACGLGALDAMAAGRTPVVPHWGGFYDYITNKTGFPIIGHLEPAFGAVDAPPGLYSADERWCGVDISHLQIFLRKITQMSVADRLVVAKAGKKRSLDFSLERIGLRLQSVLAAV